MADQDTARDSISAPGGWASRAPTRAARGRPACDGTAYDVAADPGEHQDLAAERPEIVAALLEELTRIQRTAPRYPRTTRLPPPPSEAMLEHSSGIGYAGDDE